MDNFLSYVIERLQSRLAENQLNSSSSNDFKSENNLTPNCSNCSECNKSFNDKYDCDKHVKNHNLMFGPKESFHSQDKYYKLKYCQKTFKVKNNKCKNVIMNDETSRLKWKKNLCEKYLNNSSGQKNINIVLI